MSGGMESGKFATVVVVISCIYILIGGLVFRALEEHYDLTQQQEIKTALRDFFYNGSSCFTLQELQSIMPIIQTGFSYGVNPFSNKTTHESHWDLYSSVFFSVTVVTTIGYGNIPLRTSGGRIFCIFYALVGIPLCLVTLFVIGIQEKRLIYFLARKLSFCFRNNEKLMHACSTLMVSVGGSVVFIYLSAIVFMEVEGWPYRDSIYYCLITLLTVGFGDFVAGYSDTEDRSVWYRLLIALWILFGLSWCTIVISQCQDLYNDLFKETEKVAGVVGGLIESSMKNTMHNISEEISKGLHSKGDHDHDHDKDSSDSEAHESKTSIKVKPAPTKKKASIKD